MSDSLRHRIARKALDLILRDRAYPAPEMILMRSRRRRLFEPADYEDYARVSALELLGHEIVLRDVPGACAELGVYRGEFARLINALFAGRKLYLFDTFEGFVPEEVEAEGRFGFHDPTKDFKDTDVETVLAAMPSPGDCVVRKGRFPETAEGLVERFAFVSIDADLYTPVLAGLRYFYPRLSPGGYIMVHDYNNYASYPGPKAAVEEFCLAGESIPFVPLPDRYGTAVLKK
jgi:O-methyltransferase